MSKMRKVTALLCLLAVMLVPCQAVFASEPVQYEVNPRMTYIADYSIDFGIYGTTAEVDVMVNGDVLDATRAKVIAELQVQSGNSWLPVAIWTDDQNYYKARVIEEYSVVKGHTYRVKGTFMVWEGSASESVISYSSPRTA